MFPKDFSRECEAKARFKRRTLHVPNLMQMRKIYCFRSFALVETGLRMHKHCYSDKAPFIQRSFDCDP